MVVLLKEFKLLVFAQIISDTPFLSHFLPIHTAAGAKKGTDKPRRESCKSPEGQGKARLPSCQNMVAGLRGLG